MRGFTGIAGPRQSGHTAGADRAGRQKERPRAMATYASISPHRSNPPHRRQDASAVVIEDAVLAPRVVSRHELERAPGQRMEGMGDAESRCGAALSPAFDGFRQSLSGANALLPCESDRLRRRHRASLGAGRLGLATTGGTVSNTGIAGLTLGGGLGWLMGKHGLTVDNLISADVVTADGTFRMANATDNADLFWALRGGGGNFGVVTSLEYQLHSVTQVLGGLVLYPLEQAPAVFRFTGTSVHRCPTRPKRSRHCSRLRRGCRSSRCCLGQRNA